MSVYYSNVPVLRYKKTDKQDNAFLYETQSIALFFFEVCHLNQTPEEKCSYMQCSTVQYNRGALFRMC